MTLNTWYHIAVTFDVSNHRAVLYLNGIPKDTDSNVYEIGNKIEDIRFSSGSFKGGIDEVRIYNRALDASEIQKHYNKEFNNSTDLVNLVGLWHLDEEEGTTAYDDSPFNHDGTLIKGPDWIKPSDAPVSIYTTALEKGNLYKYSAKAVGVKVTSNFSNEISFTAPFCLAAKPDLQVNPQCDGLDSQLKLSWQDDSNTKYWSIFKGREGETPTLLVDTILISYTDSNVQSGIDYTYYVVARGKDVDTYSDAITKTAPDYCQNAPQKPNLNPPEGNVTAQCYGYNSRMLVDWGEDPNGNTISFSVLRCWKILVTDCQQVADFSEVYSDLAPTSTKYLDSFTGGEEGNDYVYMIEAFGSGEDNFKFSEPSEPVTAPSCSSAAPNPPGLSLIATISTGDSVAVYSRWLDVGNADYYKIFRTSSPWENVTVDDSDPESCPILNAQINGLHTPGEVISFTDRGWQGGSSIRCGLIDGQTYSYQVVAYNLNAPFNSLSGYPYGGTVSNEIEVQVPLASPGDFTLSGARTGSMVYLTWTRAAVTPSGGDVKYDILRSNTSSFSSFIVITGCSDIVVPAPLEGGCDDLAPSNFERFYKAVAKNSNNSGETDSNIIEIDLTLPTWKEISPF